MEVKSQGSSPIKNLRPVNDVISQRQTARKEHFETTRAEAQKQNSAAKKPADKPAQTTNTQAPVENTAAKPADKAKKAPVADRITQAQNERNTRSQSDNARQVKLDEARTKFQQNTKDQLMQQLRNGGITA